VPGEAADPGSLSGKTGTPDPQVVNTPFSVTVNAVDAYWNVVPAADTVGITSSDALANLPPDAALAGGTGVFSVTFQTGGLTTVTATDVSDGTKTASTSAGIAVTNQAPLTGSDGYEMVADNILDIAAPGVLANDADPELQPFDVGSPRPVSGPAHGSLTLNADGSFSYTPTGGYSGTDTFTYVATDGAATSAQTTVTITIRDHALISGSGWDTSFSASRYVEFSFPPYVAAGSTVTDATFHFAYRSLDAAGTECYYVEVYRNAALLGTHGSPAAPISCNGTASYVTDDLSLPEVDRVARANRLTVRVYMSDSAGAQSQINLAKLTVNYYLP
jgi:VCBS repeat-containing protein